MIWATDALQSDREAVAKKLMPSYPKEAAVKSSLHSPYGIYRWELETLLIQLLLTPKEEKRAEGNFVLDCSKFDAIRDTINRLRGLENVEAGRYLGNGLNIFGEMHRIAQRQFHWQHGYLSLAALLPLPLHLRTGKVRRVLQRHLRRIDQRLHLRGLRHVRRCGAHAVASPGFCISRARHNAGNRAESFGDHDAFA